jgi:hypothetical protein
MGGRVSTTPEFPNQPVRPIGSLLITGVGIMVTKFSIAIAIAVGVCLGSGMARSDLQTFAAVPAAETKIDFDQVFRDATRQRQSEYVNRARKSDRLNFRSVSPEIALLPYCEPLASPFTDPILGRIVGRDA